jgi:beta-glucosidase
MAKATMYFPPDFLWGTATSSHQVEGINNNNDWWLWEQEESHILKREKSGLACNWWENAEADLDRATEMGTNAHRLSLEWSRIEPEPSVFDNDALARYREILQAMYHRDIEPMVTLHHFTIPQWLVEKGDFGSEIVVDYFRRYTAKVAEALGDLIPKWITINEPQVFTVFRYLADVFPRPAKKGWTAAFEATRNLLRCHAVAYHTIKDVHPNSIVGVAKHYRPIEAWPPGNFLDRWWAGRVHWLFNDMWMDSMNDGRLRWPIGRGKIEHLAGTFDFVGINYYSRSLVRFPPRAGQLYEQRLPPGAEAVDGDFFEVYPSGLFKGIKAYMKYKKPIYITENGLPDSADRLRPSFILRHLREVWRAVSFNFPVMGYYHWSLIDNFEWDRGWSQRFGLIEMEPETQERTLRPSAKLYSEICHSGSITSDMAARYAPDLLETMFPGQAPPISKGPKVNAG